MDARVVRFLARFDRAVQHENFQPAPFVKRLQALHKNVKDTESREHLIGLLISLTNFYGRALMEKFPDQQEMVIGFLRQNVSIYHMMLRHETLVDGVIDPERLVEVTDREILAGRMKENDPLRVYAMGGEYDIEGADGLWTEDEVLAKRRATWN